MCGSVTELSEGTTLDEQVQLADLIALKYLNKGEDTSGEAMCSQPASCLCNDDKYVTSCSSRRSHCVECWEPHPDTHEHSHQTVPAEAPTDGQWEGRRECPGHWETENSSKTSLMPIQHHQ